MGFQHDVSYYDLLDIASDASPQEVREAYIRSKATYARDNLALYSLVNTEEREEALKKIEEAYFILSHPEKRKQYDQRFGFIQPMENPFTTGGDSNHEPIDSEPFPNNVISIDRVPPMESTFNSDSL